MFFLLKRSLYGLKQATRVLNKCLTDALLSLGFVGSKTDCSLFYMPNADVKLFCLVYVDDILVMVSNLGHITNLITKLKTQFAVRDLGKSSYFLGIQANWKPGRFYLSQSKYATNLFNCLQMGRVVSSPHQLHPHPISPILVDVHSLIKLYIEVLLELYNT